MFSERDCYDVVGTCQRCVYGFSVVVAEPGFSRQVPMVSFILTATAALITALIGARRGALAAQKIAKNHKQHEELIKEIRACNAGITISTFMLDYAVGVYEVAHPMRENYLESMRLHNLGTPVITPQEVRGISASTPPIVELRKIIFEDVTAPVSALRAIMSLSQAVEHAVNAIESRNELLENSGATSIPTVSVLLKCTTAYLWAGWPTEITTTSS